MMRGMRAGWAKTRWRPHTRRPRSETRHAARSASGENHAALDSIDHGARCRLGARGAAHIAGRIRAAGWQEEAVLWASKTGRALHAGSHGRRILVSFGTGG